MPIVHVSTPCLVYVKTQSPQGGFQFSHCCASTYPKLLPNSLRTAELRLYDTRQNWTTMCKSVFLVLVSGDVAQCVSVANSAEKQRMRFLYHGSSYARKTMMLDFFPSELDESSISLHFYATMAVFDARRHALSAVIPVESGVCLFPRKIREGDIPKLSSWIESCIKRSLHTSVWVNAHGDSYNEWSRACNPRDKCNHV